MSTEPSLDEQIEQVQEELRGVLDEYGALRPGCALLARNYKAILASLNRLRALPRERECICDDHQGTHMRCPQHGTDYIDHDAVAREQAVDKGPRLILLKQLELAAQFLDRKDCHVMGESVRTAIAALSPQAYTPAALSTDTSADTSSEPVCGYQSFRNHTCVRPEGHAGEHSNRVEVGMGHTWGTNLDDLPLKTSRERGEVHGSAQYLGELIDWVTAMGDAGGEPGDEAMAARVNAILRHAPVAAPVEMERDANARRYEFLRAHWDEPQVTKLHPWDEFSPDPDQLDAQIDAAIAAAGEGA